MVCFYSESKLDRQAGGRNSWGDKGDSKPLPKISNLNYNGGSVSEPEMIAESSNSFFVESIASLKPGQ